MDKSSSRAHLPPLTALRSFEAAARSGSFTQAAAVLGVTHGAVSRQVKVLEEWAGVALFDRVGKRVRLTAAGRRFAAHATEALDDLALAGQTLRGTGAVARVLTINALPTFAMRWLLPRLSDFQSRHPAVELRLVTSVDPLGRAKAAGFDVAVRRETGRVPSGYRHAAFLWEKEVPVCSPALIAPAKTLSLADLQRFPLLAADTRPGAWDRWFVHAGLEGGVDAAVLRRFDHFYLALQAAVDGLGLVLGPLPLIADEIRTKRLICPIDVPGLLADPYSWFMPEGRSDDPLLADFVDWLARSAAG